MKIEILDIIDSWYGINPKEIMNKILKADKKEEITLIVNSPGGEVFGSIGIMEALRLHTGTVTSYVMGLAGSAASFIVIGGSDKVIMGKYSHFMIHQAATFAFGNAQDMHKTGDLLSRIDKTITSIYTEKAKSGHDILKLVEDETWLNAEESVKIGFADEILEKDDEQETKNLKNVAHWKDIINNRNNFSGITKNFLELYDKDELDTEVEAEIYLRLLALRKK